ncbi:hypothetical protein [Polaribacter sp.]|uniref:hypothetical protein n=1 Tax=Polaribacter sp. TaxID=1920175 RepID=UPI003EF3D7EC
MKKIFLLILCFSLTNCYFDRREEPIVDIVFSRYNPVTLERTVFENSIAILDNTEVITSSKIYIIDNYIFINDKRTGFHIFDNSDPSNPIKKKFLKIPGATDIAIRNNTLYINQATDLVILTLNFNDFSVKVNNRIKNVFPELRSPDGEYFSENNKVVVNWIEK